jgi:hypothetical protein
VFAHEIALSCAFAWSGVGVCTTDQFEPSQRTVYVVAYEPTAVVAGGAPPTARQVFELGQAIAARPPVMVAGRVASDQFVPFHSSTSVCPTRFIV